MRQVTRKRIITGAALGVLSILTATGCSGSLSAEGVATESSTMLAQQIGQEPDGLTCEEDLPAEVGAEIRCEIEIGGESIGATATVTEVDGNEVGWEIRVDDAPQQPGRSGPKPGPGRIRPRPGCVVECESNP